MKKRSAFTLAEVLITLGIIGIVSAMTLPTLIGKINQVKTEAILKEDYAILQQVLKLAESQDASVDTIPDNMPGLKNWFDIFIMPNLKTGSVCYDSRGCWTSGDSYNLSGNTVMYNRKGLGIGYGIITIRLYNGSNLCLDGYSAGDMLRLFGIKTTTSFAIYIDTNGDKLPNTVGKDIFVVGWKEGNLVPAGTDVSMEEVNSNCSVTATGNNAGYYCMRKIMTGGWKK